MTCTRCGSTLDPHHCSSSKWDGPFWTEADAAAERADDAAYAIRMAGEEGELPEPPAPTSLGALPPRPASPAGPQVARR